ncbi:hypothetical protein DAPPUDRAFT_113867 [Daphnia pulex]|uniref:Tc1-like transposase DDE domain-containing protein n=3 Tax=Daphnia pulex TaxID=6669 RepID=E9HGC0_DAPPU|nr:hypothetical protein DAPPUDRAFT_113867 [Daphnia pulex]|eukprot:EFX69198.1 hypothetical protein DAPPUDRAFT_113867 [Daphnia pulex]
MFRPELTLDQKISRASAAKNMIKNGDKYTIGVAYGDSQRFRFEDNGTISLYHQSEKANIPNTVLAWSCMSTINSTISRVDGRLNSAKYSNLLENHVLPLREQTSSNMIQYVHDWFPVHHSAAMKKFYSENRNDLILLDWPWCFGDIMPVEWLWKVMINELNEKQIKVFSEQRLWEEIFKVWQKVCTKDFVFSLLNNITVNLERVVKNQGDYVD